MTNIKYITDTDFDNATLKHGGFSIVECVNGNLGQLQIMQPILLKLKENMPFKLRHYRIDMLKYPFVVEQFYVL
ncbi:MAG: hypothetical protein P1P88_26490, partial [Bacteroidales bacterium]|nr:hypothetical protein [Bacteroidales bacterium]